MSPEVKKQIAALQLKISVLRRAIDETDSALAGLLETEAGPAPRQRQNLKKKRLMSAEENFHRYNKRPA